MLLRGTARQWANGDTWSVLPVFVSMYKWCLPHPAQYMMQQRALRQVRRGSSFLHQDPSAYLFLAAGLSLSLSFGRIICTELRRGGWIRQGRIRGIGEREPTRKLTRFASLFAASASRPRLLFPPSRTGTQKWKLRPDYNSLLHKTLSLSLKPQAIFPSGASNASGPKEIHWSGSSFSKTHTGFHFP